MNLKILDKPLIISDFTHKKVKLKIIKLQKIGNSKIAYCYVLQKNENGDYIKIRTSIKMSILAKECSKFLNKDFKKITIKDIESLEFDLIGFKGMNINKTKEGEFFIRIQKNSKKFYISFLKVSSNDSKNSFKNLLSEIGAKTDKLIISKKMNLNN